METLSGPEIPPHSGNAPKQLVIFLHGVGADGNDLINIGGEIAQALPDAQFISPNAPFPFDMAPFGYQWFSLKDYVAGMEMGENQEKLFKENVNDEKAQRAAGIINNFIDEKLAEHGLREKNLALFGFSQGAMMALFVALRRKKPLAGVISCSGALINSAALATEIKAKPPVCLIHGEDDEVVPFALMARAESGLKELGVEVTAHKRPMMSHGIDYQSLEIARNFLLERLG